MDHVARVRTILAIVTLEEFIRHMVTAALFMGVIGVVPVAYVRYRYNTAQRKYRRWLLYYAGWLGVIALLSSTGNVIERRCRRDPSEFCRYHDNIPAIAVIAFAFAVTGIGRAMFLASDR